MARPIGPDEKLLILDDFESGKHTIVGLARKYGRSDAAIRQLVHQFHPTTALATKLIRANALRMAQKVIKHATVEETIDVLSRPNIDVLKPHKVDNRGMGVFVSVAPGTCGAMVDPAPQMQQPAIDVAPEPPEPLQFPAPVESPVPESLVVDQPGTPSTIRTRTRSKRKRREKVRPDPSRQVVESAPSRVAIARVVPGPRPHNSGIHLRYDI